MGDPQRGFVQMADMINMSRLSNGMRAAGMMRRALTEALFVALAATALEAITHHGLDNLTVQLGASAAAWALG